MENNELSEVKAKLKAAEQQNEINEALLYAMRQDMRESREKMEAMLADNVTLKSRVATVPGLYAIRYCDNWDGEGDVYTMLARMEDDGQWTDAHTGMALLEYEGDKVLQSWPLFDVATPATDVIIREIRSEGIDMLVADKVFDWLDSYSADASKFASQLRAGNVEGGE